MPAPVIFAVDEDTGALRSVDRELADRYERSYRGSGPDLLGRVRDLHAHAQRGLPIADSPACRALRAGDPV